MLCFALYVSMLLLLGDARISNQDSKPLTTTVPLKTSS